MLERIEEIQGIGLLHQLNGKPFSLKKATLVYADNGRGKSTLTTVLRSLADGDPSLVLSRKTLDGTNQPSATIQLSNGHKVIFKDEKWSEQRPELLVFDAEFVTRNVHSGGDVDTEHRKNLLQFALGEAAVTARSKEAAAAGIVKTLTESVSALRSQLTAHAQGIPEKDFIALTVSPDADEEITNLRQRLSAARDIARLQTRPSPKKAPEPSFPVDDIFNELNHSLNDVHLDAETVVIAHIKKLGHTQAEAWLSQGREFKSDSNCPYCDQDTTSSELISAYKTHFNNAYKDLKLRISRLPAKVDSEASAQLAHSISSAAEVAATQVNAWSDQVAVSLPAFDATTCNSALIAFRDLIHGFVSQKIKSPTDSIGSQDDRNLAHELWLEVVAPIRSLNASIEAAITQIEAYKKQLAGESIQDIHRSIALLEAGKRRNDPVVDEIITNLEKTQTDLRKAEKEKKDARENLDKLMSTTLAKYQNDINALLMNFGASFSIKNLSANFRGNAPRSEYCLELRGKEVALEGGSPSFSNTLSEGDKRALAFAFFVASALDDPKLPDRIVVIDDPMCSLDMNRRNHTRAILRKLLIRSRQLLVLAHDPFFLRDLRDGIEKDDKSASIAPIQLKTAANGYTEMFTLNIDNECESAYASHHRTLSTFSTTGAGDLHKVAKSIRPLLEGYLHRRFPGLIPRGQMFGQIVVMIRDAANTSPLSHAKNLVSELNEINDYAGQFHHDTNPDADIAIVTPAELKTYVERALGVIYKGTV